MLVELVCNEDNILYSDYVLRDLNTKKVINLSNIMDLKEVYVLNAATRKNLKNIIFIEYGKKNLGPVITIHPTSLKVVKDKSKKRIPKIDFNTLRSGYNIKNHNNKQSLQTQKDFGLNEQEINVLSYDNFEISKEIYSLGLSITDISYWEKNSLKRLYINTNLGDIYININKGTFHLDDKGDKPKYFDMNSAKHYIMKTFQLKDIDDIKAINKNSISKLKSMI